MQKHVKKTKKNKMLLSSLLMFSIIFGIYSGQAYAGNISDTNYYFNYSGNGGDLGTEHREKQDFTSSYVYHKGNVGGYFSVRNNGRNYTYGAYHYYVGTWQSAYLPNIIKESELNRCQLYITPETHNATTIYGQWSPDSV